MTSPLKPSPHSTPPHWSVQILTLFPQMFPGTAGMSLAGKALADGLWELHTTDIRDHATDKHRTVDDTPYGGGAGMVMRPDIIADALHASEEKYGKAAKRIYLSPRGRVLNKAIVQELVNAETILLLCGRYEGVDQRVLDAEGFEEISIGDFILSGGEVAALTLIDACVRLLPTVMGNEETVHEESFANGLLEYPHYTRPPLWQGLGVPEVLLSGHHENIKTWRKNESEKLTQTRRPDLWRAAPDLWRAAPDLWRAAKDQKDKK